MFPRDIKSIHKWSYRQVIHAMVALSKIAYFRWLFYEDGFSIHTYIYIWQRFVTGCFVCGHWSNILLVTARQRHVCDSNKEAQKKVVMSRTHPTHQGEKDILKIWYNFKVQRTNKFLVWYVKKWGVISVILATILHTVSCNCKICSFVVR